MSKKTKKDLVKENISKLSEMVSGELKKATDQVQDVVNDFYQQAEDIQKQIKEPVANFIKDMEDLRERETNRIQGEYNKAVNEIKSLQEQLLDRLGLKSATKSTPATTSAKKTTARKKASVKKATAKKSTAKKNQCKENHRQENNR